MAKTHVFQHAGVAVVACLATAATVLLRAGSQSSGITVTSKQPSRIGCIVGRVVDGRSGAALEGALVVTSVKARIQDRVVTDGAGAFVVSGLETAAYEVRASLIGYTAQPGNTVLPMSGSVAVTTSPDGRCVVSPAIRLWPHATVSGIIADETGEPLRRVRVRAYRRSLIAGVARFNESASGVSDDAGRFVIDNLNAGRYVVAYAPIYSTTPLDVADAVAQSNLGVPWLGEFLSIGEAGSRTGSLHVGGSLLGVAKDVALPRQNRQGLQVYDVAFAPTVVEGMPPAVLTLGAGEKSQELSLRANLVESHSITGRLRTSAGPLSYTAVRLVRPTIGNAHADVVIATGFSNREGLFKLVAVPPGRYELRVYKTVAAIRRGADPSRPPEPPGRAGSLSDSDRSLWSAVRVELPSASAADLEVLVSPTFVVSGRLSRAAGGRPTTEELAQLSVTVETDDGRALPPAVRPARFSTDGTFSIAGLPAGKYVFRLMGSVPGDLGVASFAMDGQDITDAGINVTGDVSGIVLAITEIPTGITGTVRLPIGTAAEDVAVLLFASRAGAWTERPLSARRFRAVQLNRSGHFVISGLPADSYYAIAVRADTTDEWQTVSSLTALAKAASQITVINGRTTAVDLVLREVK